MGFGQVDDRTKEIEATVVRLQKEGRYREAIPLAEEVVEINRQVYGENDVNFATASEFLARLYDSAGEDHDAEVLYERSLKIRENTQGPEALEVAVTLDCLGRIYLSRSDFGAAESAYRRSLAIRKKSAGENDPLVAVSLNNLATVYDRRGQLQEARLLFEQALAIRERAPGVNALDVAVSLNNLAASYLSLADYAAAEPLYRRSLVIEERVHGEEAPAVASALTQLGLLHQELGDYDRAVSEYQRALEILAKGPGNQRAVAVAFSGLASVYEARGDYARAERLLRRAAETCDALGQDRPEVAAVLNNLAILYASLGELDAAEPLYLRSLAIREKTLGGMHPELAASMNNLAMLYEARGDYARAEELYLRAMGIYHDTLGDEHPDSETVVSNLAGLLLDRGKLDEAFGILMKGDRPTGLGRYYLLKGDFHEAYAQLVRAVDAAERRHENQHLLAADIGLGLSLEGLEQPGLAADSYRDAVELIEDQRSALGPLERGRFLSGQVGAGFKRIIAYEGLVRTSAKLDPSEASRWSEYTKARQLLEGAARSRAAPGLPDEVAAREERLTARLSALYEQREATLSKNPQLFTDIETRQIPEAKRELNDFVIQLRGKYPAYAAYRYPQPLGVEGIALRPGENLLEYAVTSNETFAWLIRDGKVAKFATIPLGRGALAQRVEKYRSLFRGIRHTRDLRSDVEQGRELYDLLVRDMLSGVTAGDKLIVVPDGSLSLVPFEALVADGDNSGTSSGLRYLGDLYPIQYAQSATVLSNARTLAVGREGHSDEAIMVLADPIFSEADSRWRSEAGSGSAAETSEKISASAAKGLALPRLEKTEQLLRTLTKTFGSPRVRGLSGLRASERELRRLPLDNYRYLVFATHGAMGGQLRYLGEPALVLTQDGADRFDAEFDGYLTLSEVMALKLDAEVVALTACNTGVGIELDGEGVLGMGWAFEYAGARNVVMSLWSVDQESTVMLMQSFFAHLQKEMGPQQALRLARLELRKAGYSHPFFWAPFVLIGEG